MAVSSWNDNGQKQFVYDPCKFFFSQWNFFLRKTIKLNAFLCSRFGWFAGKVVCSSFHDF